jgi:hypothetical protein
MIIASIVTIALIFLLVFEHHRLNMTRLDLKAAQRNFRVAYDAEGRLIKETARLRGELCEKNRAITSHILRSVEQDKELAGARAENQKLARRNEELSTWLRKRGGQVSDLMEQSLLTQQYANKGDVLLGLARERIDALMNSLNLANSQRDAFKAAAEKWEGKYCCLLQGEDATLRSARAEIIRLNMLLNPSSVTIYRHVDGFVDLDYCVGYDGFLAAVDKDGTWTGCDATTQAYAEDACSRGVWIKSVMVPFDDGHEEVEQTCLVSKPKLKKSKSRSRKATG